VDRDAPRDQAEQEERADSREILPALKAERRVTHELDAVV
jgi:hypothetical protein